jgi:G3E family GTPase
MNSDRIPLIVIGGYLGVGKTTLLNHILRNNAGLRLAVIVNDFGDINIDAELIENQDGDTINLANGCICCSLAGGFVQALNALAEMEQPPEHNLIEASGVADPHNLSQYGYMDRLHRNGVIVVADAETVQAKSVDKYVGQTVVRQLQGADLILLNKTDLVDGDALKDVRTWLQELVPDARIVDAAHGVVPLPILLGSSRIGGPVRTAIPDHHHPEEEYETWSFTSDQPLDGDAFRAFVETLPEGVLRAKGIIYLQENPEERNIFQLVGKRWSLNAEDPWEDEQPSTKLVMICLSGCVDLSWLESRFGSL